MLEKKSIFELLFEAILGSFTLLSTKVEIKWFSVPMYGSHQKPLIVRKQAIRSF